MIRYLPAGSTYRVTISCGVLIAATVTRQSWEPLGLHDGAEVVAAFKTTAPHVIRQDLPILTLIFIGITIYVMP